MSIVPRRAAFICSVESEHEVEQLIADDRKRVQQWVVAGVRDDAAGVLAAAIHT